MPPLPQSAAPKSQTLGLLIALAILTAVGFLVLYFKIDMEANAIKDRVGSVIGKLNDVSAGMDGLPARMSALINDAQPVTTPSLGTIVASTEFFTVRANDSCKGKFTISKSADIDQGRGGQQIGLEYAMPGQPSESISNITVQSSQQWVATDPVEAPHRPKILFQSGDQIIGEWGHPINGRLTPEVGESFAVLDPGCDYTVTLK